VAEAADPKVKEMEPAGPELPVSKYTANTMRFVGTVGK